MACTSLHRLRFGLSAIVALLSIAATLSAAEDPAVEHFEKRVRPLLIERCHKCHLAERAKGGLRLNSAESLRRGGESGPVVVPGKPDESLIIQAVRHEQGLKMPPDGKLTESQIADLVAWVKMGAVWPELGRFASTAAPKAAGIAPLVPDNPDLAPHLQLWLRAEDLSLADGDPVSEWPDHSGHGRDLTATKGVRSEGTGQPATYAKNGGVQRRPAVRFQPATRLAASPDNLVALKDDAELSVVLVMNVQPGEDAAPSRASLFKPFDGKPIILTITMKPGPMRTMTAICINGEPVGKSPEGAPGARDTIPEIEHPGDLDVTMGRAAGWLGGFRGDVSEVVVYNHLLNDDQRHGLEAHLGEKYAIALRVQSDATREEFTSDEKAFWAYQPVVATQPPPVDDDSWIATPVDRFVLSALSSHGMKPAAAADKRTLLRRAAFDLIGLPPTPEDVDAFLKDESPQAFDRVVTRLLDSPQYGERWARHWLDVVRYADTTANDANAVMRFAWRYRNYVIDAFNRDLPYDQFLIEQLAGDLLPTSDDLNTRIRRAIAPGFLMVGPKALAETDKEQSRLDIVDDQIDVVGRAMLGLTLACARCHDHKFDAIRAFDYYALAGIFRSTEPFKDESRNSSMWWEFPLFQPPGEKPFVVMAPQETTPRDLRVHLRGNRFTLGPLVPRGFLQVVSPESPTIAPSRSGRLELARWIANPSNPLTARVMVNRVWQHHFGRGLVATSDNFGARGERPTHPELLDYLAAEFVRNGWSIKKLHRQIMLSSTYREQSQRSDTAHENDSENRWLSHVAVRRLSAEELRDAILAVSGQLDRSPGTTEAADILWKEAEILDEKRGFAPNRLKGDHPFYSEFRKRSIYLPVVRNMLPDVFALFDGADPNNVTAVRNDTTVPSQALYLLNSSFVREQSRHFAVRVLADDKASDDDRFQHAHRLALARPASTDELVASRGFIEAYLAATIAQARPESERRLSAWQSYCQSLLCSNEFLYVE